MDGSEQWAKCDGHSVYVSLGNFVFHPLTHSLIRPVPTAAAAAGESCLIGFVY